jgi:hypothetical protein
LNDYVTLPIGPPGWTGVICGQRNRPLADYLTVPQVATIRHRCATTIRNGCREGLLPAVKVRGRWLVRTTDVGYGIESLLQPCRGAIVKTNGQIACERCGQVPDWA